MIKKIIKQGLNLAGFEIRRTNKEKNTPLVSSRTQDLTLHHTATGDYYLPTDAHQDVIAIAIKNNKIFDKEVLDIASKYIKQGTAVLDIGANFGQMSVLFSKLVGDNGTIFSFEADNFIFEILKKNIIVNNEEDHIKPIFGAVYNTPDEVLYFPEQDFKEFGTYGSYGIDYKKNTGGREVKSITIDSLQIAQPISFIKIDIQGGDLQAMEGAIETIKRNKMPILFEYEYLFEERLMMCFQDYVDFVSKINYRFERVINGQNYLILPNQ